MKQPICCEETAWVQLFQLHRACLAGEDPPQAVHELSPQLQVLWDQIQKGPRTLWSAPVPLEEQFAWIEAAVADHTRAWNDPFFLDCTERDHRLSVDQQRTHTTALRWLWHWLHCGSEKWASEDLPVPVLVYANCIHAIKTESFLTAWRPLLEQVEGSWTDETSVIEAMEDAMSVLKSFVCWRVHLAWLFACT